MSEERSSLSSISRQVTLFELPLGDVMSPAMDEAQGGGRPRLQCAVRDQIAFRQCCWDDLLPEDHQARIVWDYALSVDYSPLYAAIRSVENNAGNPATDPRILFALWLYATLRGIGSARELARRCDRRTGEVAFQWMCGDVPVNHHTLSDFRVDHLELLDHRSRRSDEP